MSFALFIETVSFGVNPRCKDNALILTKNVSATQSSMDDVQAFALIQELQDRLTQDEVKCLTLPIRAEPRHYRYLYENCGEGIMARDAISFHNETDEEGNITRRVVVLYPVNPMRQNHLPKRNLIERIESSIKDGAEVELIDLRGFEEERQYLEGNGAVVFSADGKYVYMARSSRSSEQVLDVLCSEENLNIPKENRFVFNSAFPPVAESVYQQPIVAHHTDIMGWCGRGICAWATDAMVFDSAEESDAFQQHLEKNYDVVIRLSNAEAAAFAGNAREVVLPTSGKPALIISLMALKALSMKNQRLIQSHYGESNILTFYGEVIERRCGTSVASCLITPQTMGAVDPNNRQATFIDVLEIGKDLKK